LPEGTKWLLETLLYAGGLANESSANEKIVKDHVAVLAHFQGLIRLKRSIVVDITYTAEYEIIPSGLIRLKRSIVVDMPDRLTKPSRGT
jgi:hypothetical protein